MEAAPIVAPVPDPEATPAARRWPDWALLAALMALSVVIHAWLVSHTAVAARDSIGYIRFALQLQEKPLHWVLTHTDQHPLYPLSVLAVSLPVRYFAGGTTCDAMVLSCQLASSLAAVLLVIPMFYLGCELFDRRVGFWSAALFQTLPVSARITSDALSEATYLLLVTTTLLLAARALRHRSVLRFVLCGLFGGLAYLTRPEGALPLVVAGLVLLGMQAVAAWRRPWLNLFASSFGLVAGALLVAGPYMATIGGITVKPTAHRLLHGNDGFVSPRAPTKQTSMRGTNAALFAWLPAIWWEESDDSPPWWWGLQAEGHEIMKSYNYRAWFPVLLGLWYFRGRLRSSPGAWVVLMVAGAQGLLLWRMAEVVGYLSERHVQLLILCGVFWAVAAVVFLADWLAAWSGKRWLSWTLVALFVSLGLPGSMRSMHNNRSGHREAGLWLADHARPFDDICDPFCWAHFYAGRVFVEDQEILPPPGCQMCYYVVLEDSDNPHNRLPLMYYARRAADQGTRVYHWQPPTGKAKDQPGVDIYQFWPK
jgi:hypothetical protein